MALSPHADSLSGIAAVASMSHKFFHQADIPSKQLAFIDSLSKNDWHKLWSYDCDIPIPVTHYQKENMSTESFTREALTQLDALRNFAFKLCRDEHYTNDLVQETMLKACRSFHTYQEGTNCRAWLFQICKNSYINDYRRKQYQTLTMDFTEDNSGMNNDDEQRTARVLLSDNRSAEAHEAMVGDEVATALDALPADYQTALILSDIEGYTYEEIAEFSRTPLGTVRSRIHRGRKMLALQLDEYAQQHGYGPSLFSYAQ